MFGFFVVLPQDDIQCNMINYKGQRCQRFGRWAFGCCPDHNLYLSIVDKTQLPYYNDDIKTGFITRLIN